MSSTSAAAPADTTAALAHAVGLAGHVLGVDISETLIEAARAHRLDNATFVVGDAATHPFQAGHYDLVFSRFGVMFFADPVAAFRNIRRALKPAGRLVFIAWRTPQENPWGTMPVRAAQPFLPPQPRPGPEDPGQFSFGDRARVERILGEAGFQSLRLEPIDRQIWMGDSVADVARRRRPLRSAGPSLRRRRACGHRKGQAGHRRGARAARGIRRRALPAPAGWSRRMLVGARHRRQALKPEALALPQA